MTIRDLEPKLLWSIFDEITQVPRPSKKEEKIRAYLLDFAKSMGLKQNRRCRECGDARACNERKRRRSDYCAARPYGYGAQSDEAGNS